MDERPMGRIRVTVLDDYQGVASEAGPWKQLGDRIDLDVLREHVDDDAVLLPRLHDADVVVVMRERTTMDRERLQALPNLRLLVTIGRTNAAIDVRAASELGIVVTGTPSRPHGPVEITWASILGLARQLVTEHQRVRDGAWQSTIGRELHGRTLGIVGLGRIGAHVADVGNAFGMSVLAWSHHLTDEDAAAHHARRVELDELLAGSDVVTIHSRLSPRTERLLGARELALLRPGALLVNTARSRIVDEDALVAALGGGRLGGVGLDVYDVEPLPVDHPLRTASDVLLTPHLGYVTDQNYRTYFTGVVEDIEAWLAGSPIRVLRPSST